MFSFKISMSLKTFWAPSPQPQVLVGNIFLSFDKIIAWATPTENRIMVGVNRPEKWEVIWSRSHCHLYSGGCFANQFWGLWVCLASRELCVCGMKVVDMVLSKTCPECTPFCLLLAFRQCFVSSNVSFTYKCYNHCVLICFLGILPEKFPLVCSNSFRQYLSKRCCLEQWSVFVFRL